ncbi:MAG: DUF5011 domain-containing protein [Erysipelotrichaceae bacterium]|nr:DUF5011 domain-containing protein [Erysipelotrichaceae bacterium]MDY5251124.1 DUF5011 domain-containing protein [Erysipelotrichaceae bacterium]
MLNKLNLNLIKTSAFALVLLLCGCSSNATVEKQTSNTADTTPPWIDVKQYHIETIAGNVVDLSGPTAYDDVDGVCDVEISGYVDWHEPGDYFVVYSASDTSGNKTEVPITVSVVAKSDQATTTPESVEMQNEQGCADPKAKDPTKKCNAILNSEIDKFNKLFYGPKSLEQCISYTDDEEACLPIYTNDHQLWGYGAR